MGKTTNFFATVTRLSAFTANKPALWVSCISLVTWDRNSNDPLYPGETGESIYDRMQIQLVHAYSWQSMGYVVVQSEIITPESGA